MKLKSSVKFLFLFIFVNNYYYDCGANSLVENLPKCHLDDNECMRFLYESIVRDIGKTGIPELKIPPVDPLAVKNITVSILELIDISFTDGIVRGVKDCLFNKFSINITAESGYQENTCDLTLKGHYKVSPKSSLIETALGDNSIQAEGNAKVKIEKAELQFDFPFYAQKRDDGEIYIKCIYDKIKYYHKIGNIIIHVDNLYLGGQDVSEMISDMINRNWRFVMDIVGQQFVDEAVKIYFEYAGNFFDAVPARHFIVDDLSPFAKQ